MRMIKGAVFGMAVIGMAATALAQSMGMGMGVPGGGQGQPQVQQQPQPQTQAPVRGMNAMFRCTDPEGSAFVLNLQATGKMQVRAIETQEMAHGSYRFDGQSISLSVPSLSYAETSQEAYADKGLLLAFQMPSVYCGMIAHDLGPAVEGYAKCPTIGYVPGVGYQDNPFALYADHSVKWRSWDELTAVVDTLYSESYGVYLIEGNQFWMAFPFRDDKNFLSGTIDPNSGFYVNELEPDKGPCVAQ